MAVYEWVTRQTIPTTTTNHYALAVAFGGSAWVASTYPTLTATTADEGLSFSTVDPVGIGNATIQRIAYGGGRFVWHNGNSGAPWSSDSGATWNNVVLTDRGAPRSLAYVGSSFIAVCDSAVRVSSNGTSWTDYAFNSLGGGGVLFGLAEGLGGRVVTSRSEGGPIAASADGGATWVQESAPNHYGTVSGGVVFDGVLFCKFAGSSPAKVGTSVDGNTYAWQNITGNGGASVAGRVIALGEGEFLILSSGNILRISGYTSCAIEHTVGGTGVDIYQAPDGKIGAVFATTGSGQADYFVLGTPVLPETVWANVVGCQIS
jgi:hypothetical protein